MYIENPHKVKTRTKEMAVKFCTTARHYLATASIISFNYSAWSTSTIGGKANVYVHRTGERHKEGAGCVDQSGKNKKQKHQINK